jgi:excinuclease ABC subunit C
MNSRVRPPKENQDSRLDRDLKNLVEKPGVYQFYDEQGQVLYVGKSRNLKQRVNSYFRSRQENPRLRQLVDSIRRVEFVVTCSEEEALILECNLIKRLLPRYNILFRDGKTYPYLKLMDHYPYAWVEKVREVRDDGARYFGPFCQEWKVNQIVKFIQRHYKLIKCDIPILDQKGKPCMDYQIGRCDGPCFQAIDESFYAAEVSEVRAVLEGRFSRVRQILVKRMRLLASNLEFEQATRLRDQIEALEILNQEQWASNPHQGSLDILAISMIKHHYLIQHLMVRAGKIVDQTKIQGEALWVDECQEQRIPSEVGTLIEYIKQYYLRIQDPPREVCTDLEISDHPEFKSFSESFNKLFGRKFGLKNPKQGRKARLLELARKNAYEGLRVELKVKELSGNLIEEAEQLLNLGRLPRRIECFDISNTSGTNPVASMVVAIDGKLIKKLYRKFRIRCMQTPDDFEMMREVVRRRYSGSLKSREDAPDLVLIDGGVGQLHAAQEILKSLGLDTPLASLAKKEELIYVAGQEESPFQLGKFSPVRLYFQEIRDEAHRFAVTYHRRLRSKATLSSILDRIVGVGPKRKALIMKSYPDLKQLKTAKLEDLECLGFSTAVAKNILDSFQKI